VTAYAASTNQGISRNYNEDRVSIILNIKQPKSKQNINWPRCAFFGVFDGHGGTTCSDYLRDNMHLFIIHSKYFPGNPRRALINGFRNAEEHFLSQ
jgi:protein phosphatase 2C family protein 2/3